MKSKAAPKHSKCFKATPITHARLRSVVSSATTRVAGGHATPQRVFALWKQDGYYYSGIIHSIEVGDKYDSEVKFHDGNIAPIIKCGVVSYKLG